MTKFDQVKLIGIQAALSVVHIIYFIGLPVVLDRAGYSALSIGFLVGAYAIGSFGFRVASLRLGHHLEPKRVLSISIVIMVISNGLIALQYPFALAMARVLHGIGLAGFSTFAYAIAQDASGPISKSLMIGLLGGATGIGFLVGVPVGLLSRHFDQPLLACAAISACLLMAMLAVLRTVLLPETRKTQSNLSGVAPLPLICAALLSAAALGSIEAFFPLLIDDIALGTQTSIFICFAVALIAGRLTAGYTSPSLGRLQLLCLFCAIAVCFPAMVEFKMLGLAVVLFGLCYGAISTGISVSIMATRRASSVSLSAQNALSYDIGLALGAVSAGVVAKSDLNLVVVWTGALCIATGLVLTGAKSRSELSA